jgi:hypothetical protein
MHAKKSFGLKIHINSLDVYSVIFYESELRLMIIPHLIYVL